MLIIINVMRVVWCAEGCWVLISVLSVDVIALDLMFLICNLMSDVF